MSDDANRHGWRVVWTAFVVAMFGWGVGFYGPAVYLPALAPGARLADLDDLGRDHGALSGRARS